MTAEIFNPDYLKNELKIPAKNWWLKYGYPALIVALVILLIIVIYLIYYQYLSPTYKLTSLLPKNYTLALEFQINQKNLPQAQVKELLNQPVLKNISKSASQNLSQPLSQLMNNLPEELKKAERGLIFFPNEQDFGLIIELVNQNQAEKLQDLTLENLQQKIIKQKLLIISNNPELLEQMTKLSVSPLSPFDLSIALAPWLTIYFQDTFFDYNFQNQTLADLQAILQPLQSTEEQNYVLTLLAKPHQLILHLKKNSKQDRGKTTDQADNFNNYLAHLPKEPDFILALDDLKALALILETSPKLNQYFELADSLFWLRDQISLSQLLKNLQSPFIITVSGQDWQIITSQANQELLDGYLRSWLAQFTPLEKTIALPDGSLAVELLADPSSINWQTKQNEGWYIFTYQHPQTVNQIGYALKENLMILGNNLDSFFTTKSKTKTNALTNCNLDQPSNILLLHPQKLDWLKIDSQIRGFSKITAISSLNDQIKLCLRLE